MSKRTCFRAAMAWAAISLLGPPGVVQAQTASGGANATPDIVSLSKPLAGDTQIFFHGTGGPFRIQTRNSLDPAAPWFDLVGAKVSQLQSGLFMAQLPAVQDNIAFYRVVDDVETVAELKGWSFLVQVSTPANHSYFVPGESPVLTVTILDNFARGITRDALSTLSLYLYGPQDPALTKTAAKLLNASTDRTKTPHHYIDLKSNPAVQVNGNVLTYKLQAVSDEAPGTYTATIWAVLGSDAIQQIMKFADLQIGTATAEAQVVGRDNCAACHLGPVTGKLYMHHIDPGHSPTGNWSLDYTPVRTCKACHNNEGYAAYTDASATATGGKVPDPIVRRVHGVHMGSELALPFNTNSVNGDFKDYTHVEFPADVRNCTKCHTDDRWKTQPNRQSCGACHDNVWFGTKATLPASMIAHPGGTQNDDTRCSLCHDTGDITDNHHVDAPSFKQVVNLAMSAPTNGKYYVAGEAPKVTIRITDAATGNVINPTNIIEPLIATNVAATEWKRANLFVSGPRAHTVPVLTPAADNPDPTQYYAENDLRVRRDPTKQDPRIIRTAEAITYQLDGITNLAPGTYTAFVEIMPSAPLGGWAYTNFQVGTTNVEPLVAGNCTDCHGDTRMHESYFAVTFTPDICKNCHDYEHQMTGKTNWLSANYGFGAAPLARRVHGVHYGNYVDKPQEISAADDYSHLIFPQDVRNCTKCHSTSSAWTQNPSRLACLACHDDDAALAHGKLMTYDPTPQDPWSGDEVESCEICHGSDADFSPDKVHRISNPYVPPYPRAPR